MWGHGASTVAADSKTVTINSPETKQVVEYCVELYKTSMTDEVLSWTSRPNNTASRLGHGLVDPQPDQRPAHDREGQPELAEKIFITPTPAGPKGRFYTSSGFSEAIMTWSKNVPAARRS